MPISGAAMVEYCSLLPSPTETSNADPPAFITAMPLATEHEVAVRSVGNGSSESRAALRISRKVRSVTCSTRKL